LFCIYKKQLYLPKNKYKNMNNIKRNYKMSDASLSQLSDNLNQAAKRDEEQMVTFGINSAFLGE